MMLESRASVQSRGGRIRGSVVGYSAASPGEQRQVEASWQVLRELGEPGQVISSANGTWVDRAEGAALRKMAREKNTRVVVSSLCGHVPEIFSAGPLAAIAAVLLTGKLPALLGNVEHLELCAAGPATERAEDFAALATDYAGLVSGARIGLPRSGQ